MLDTEVVVAGANVSVWSENISIALGGALLISILTLWLFGERWSLLRYSTWKMMQENGLVRIVNLKALHGYIYGRWTNQYIDLLINHIIPRLGPQGKVWLSDRYHGKVLTHEQAKAILKISQDIPLRDLEQIIPYPMARNLVLKAPPDVAVYECCCRHARVDHCQPTLVCMAIGKPLVDFILEHNPKSSRRLTQQEALDLLRQEHERGHLHSAWFKDACLDRFYAICNCCRCCCVGIEAMVKYGIKMLASSGYVAQVNEGSCTSCATCEKACPFGAIQLNDIAAVKWEICMGCGVCTSLCPNEAITLIRDERKGLPLDVRSLT